MTKTPDFHSVDPAHQTIHDMLLNWSRWVHVGQARFVSPMFAQYRSNAWQWHTPEYRETCDPLEAQALEKLMRYLPRKQREAIKWNYVIRCSPAHARQALGCTYAELAAYVREGRQMLCNLRFRHQQGEWRHEART